VDADVGGPRDLGLLGDELAGQPGCDQVHPVEQGTQQPLAHALGCRPTLVPVGGAEPACRSASSPAVTSTIMG
jgi:hypothetical protein